ncbi:MAG: SpaH/EbpB family LPXTG-anchored major pilin, partial [Oscillospiraceae bacterium]|nr:SpaH/EbpB family LPXTG-anchored major pilin [Oscillospiraceae bacterium]
NATSYTIEQFETLESNSAGLKNLLAGLPNYIANKSITHVGTETVAADGTATFADLAMGEYFILPTASTSVYQLMLQKIEPTVADGKYVIDDVSFTAKHKEAAITKTADKTSVTKGEKVAYTISVDIPTYAAEATTDKSFYVADLLPDGLTLDTASIKVQIDSADVDTTAYTLYTTATTEYTFKLSVSTEQYAASWSANGGKQLVITYTATLNDNAVVNAAQTNTATFDYSNYPYVADSHQQKTATATVRTFAIKIDKFKDGSEATKLAGAKFDLYRTATQAEIDEGTAVDIPQTTPEVKGILLQSGIITDENGVGTFAKYEANGANYDYYLVETQAPSGYNILTNAVKVNFTDTDVAATAGVYTVKVPNSAGITLPITGGAGTVLFTVIGIAFMAGAVILFVISRKKVKVNNK